MFLCLTFSSMQRTMEALIGTQSLGMFSWWNCKTIQYMTYILFWSPLLCFFSPQWRSVLGQLWWLCLLQHCVSLLEPLPSLPHGHVHQTGGGDWQPRLSLQSRQQVPLCLEEECDGEQGIRWQVQKAVCLAELYSKGCAVHWSSAAISQRPTGY